MGNNICPKCKSKRVKNLTNIDYKVVAFGANPTFKCLDCGFTGEIFPELTKLQIKVKANAKENKIEDKGDYYLVSVKEKAVDNKANLAVVKLLSKYFKRKAKIIKGLKSKEKVIELFSQNS